MRKAPYSTEETSGHIKEQATQRPLSRPSLAHRSQGNGRPALPNSSPKIPKIPRIPKIPKPPMPPKSPRPPKLPKSPKPPKLPKSPRLPRPPKPPTLQLRHKPLAVNNKAQVSSLANHLVALKSYDIKVKLAAVNLLESGASPHLSPDRRRRKV